jgi:hypothetical protein
MDGDDDIEDKYAIIGAPSPTPIVNDNTATAAAAATAIATTAIAVDSAIAEAIATDTGSSSSSSDKRTEPYQAKVNAKRQKVLQKHRTYDKYQKYMKADGTLYTAAERARDVAAGCYPDGTPLTKGGHLPPQYKPGFKDFSAPTDPVLIEKMREVLRFMCQRGYSSKAEFANVLDKAKRRNKWVESSL